MPNTFYVDFEIGDDNKSGDSFAHTVFGTNGAMTSGGVFTATTDAPGFNALNAGGALVGRTISVDNGAIYALYTVSSVTNDTTLQLAAISGGTALATITGPKTWWVGGRWKTISSGATAVRVVPGDAIRVKASPGPFSTGVNCTWTSASRVLTLSSPLTKTLFMGDTAWTAVSTNVTEANDATNRKYGSASRTHTIAAGFTTGKVAYKTLGAAANLTAYTHVNFWIRSNTVTAAGVYSIRLCSDSTGDVTVATVLVTGTSAGGTTFGIVTVNTWTPIVVAVDLSGCSNINSVAIYCESDPGAVTVNVQNIFASKGPTATDGLTLWTLLGKPNAPGCGGTDAEPWVAPAYINETDVSIDAGPTVNNAATTLRTYVGTTETVALWKQEATQFVPVSGTLAGTTPNESGTGAAYYAISGGWDRTNMSSQAGYTVIDGVNGVGSGLSNALSYITWDRFAAVRCASGFAPFKTQVVTNFWATDCSIGLFLSSGSVNTQVSGPFSSHNFNYGVQVGTSANCVVSIDRLNSNGALGMNVDNTSSGLWVNFVRASNNASSAFSATTDVFINGGAAGGTIDLNGSSGVSMAGQTTGRGPAVFRNVTITQGTEATFLANNDQSIVWQNYGNVAGTHKIASDNLTITTDTSTRHTASGYSWKIAVASATVRNALYPAKLLVSRVPLKSGRSATVTCWVNRTSTSLTTKLVCPGGQCNGIEADVTASASGSANSWEQLSITLTAAEDAAADVYVYAYGAVANVFVDDVAVTSGATAAEVNTMDVAYRGQPVTASPVDSGGGVVNNYIVVNRPRRIA